MEKELRSTFGLLMQLRKPHALWLCALLLSFFFATTLFAQQANIPLNHDWLIETDAQYVQARGFVLDHYLLSYEADSNIRNIIKPDEKGLADPTIIAVPLHTSMKPWIEQGHPLRKNVALENYSQQQKLLNYEKRFPKPLVKYHYQASLLQLERKPQNEEPVFRIYVDPLLNLQGVQLINNEERVKTGPHYINTRGINAHGDIGTRISFETSFYENQAIFPYFISDYAKTNLIVPGQGRWKVYKLKGFDYAMATGSLSYSPCRNFNVQVGNGKHFVGDGYRSLLLSDNSFTYPYARLTGWFGPNKMFQYSTIYASLMNLISDSPIPAGTERLFQKKAASFYQLSANLGRTVEVSLFQGLIWNAADSMNRQTIGLAYVNPIMFTSMIGHGLNDHENFLLGATFHVDVLRTLRFYGQFVADDFGPKKSARNKTGFQLGLNYYNAFAIKHLHIEMEYNRVNPYTYSAHDSAQAYTNYAQPLAHPYGANFQEFNGAAQYKMGDFFVHTRLSLAALGADTAGYIFGQNVFAASYNAQFSPTAGENSLGQGVHTTISTFDASVGYMLNYASNLNIAIGFYNRKVSSDENIKHTQFVYMTLRTSLTNNYFDFFK